MDYPVSRDARPGEVEMVLSLQGLKYKRFTDNLRLSLSPCCDRDKKHNAAFSINHDNGMWRCWSCDKAGNWVTFCDLVKYPLDGRDRYMDREPLIEFHDTWEQHFENTKRSPVSSNKYPDIKAYCNKRGISDDTLDAFRVSNKWGSAVQFPMVSWHEDQWRRVNARNITVIERETAEVLNWFEIKGGPTHLMLGNHLLDINDKEKRAFIFEGQWDMMTAYELGLRNVFSLPNGASLSATRIGDLLQYIPHDWRIYVCTDMDTAGNRAAEAFFRALGPEKFSRLFLPEKDLNDWYRKKSDLTVDDVLATAKGFVPDMEVTTIKYEDFFSDNLEEDELIGNTPFPILNKYLSGGFYERQITSVLAGSGAGKTTIVNQIAMHVAAGKTRVGLISLEDSQKELRRKLKMVCMGTPDGENARTNLFCTRLSGKSTTHEEVIRQVQTFIQEECRLVIVDNLDFISSSFGPEKQDTFAKILKLADGSEVHVIFIWQPNKVDPSKLVTSFNQKGESRTFQDSTNYININRHPSHSAVRVMQVEKSRRRDFGRPSIYIEYDDNFNMYRQKDVQQGDKNVTPIRNLRIFQKRS